MKYLNEIHIYAIGWRFIKNERTCKTFSYTYSMWDFKAAPWEKAFSSKMRWTDEYGFTHYVMRRRM